MNWRQPDKHPCDNGIVRAGGVVLLVFAAGCLEAPPASGDASPGADASLSHRVVSGTFRHFCALVDGTAWCWGENGQSQLGDGTATHRSSAVQVLRSPDTPLTGVLQIAPGEHHTCARLDDGSVVCWGSNEYGQLGIGDADTSTHPYAETAAVNLPEPTEIAAGGDHTCALLGDESVRCWGRGISGELGDDGNTSRSAPGLPVEKEEMTLRSSRVTAGRYHSCFIDDGGRVACTGWNEDGQSGQRTGEPPEEACGYSNADEVSREDGSQLGLAADVSAGFRHTCAIVDEAVYCFGHARCGQLGNDDATSCADAPMDDGSCLEATLRLFPVRALLPASCNPVRIALGYSHSCALCADRTVQCWGSGARGRLGRGTIEQEPAPVQVLNLDAVVSLATGAESSCAVAADDTIHCWGSAEFGQLGDGTGPDPDNTELYQTLPRPVVGLPAP